MPILKKIFFFSLFIFLLTGLFWGAYNLSFKKIEEPKKDNIATEEQPAGKNDSSKEKSEKISLISEESVVAPALSADGKTVQYFSAQNGQIVSVDFFGKNKKNISTLETKNLESARWSLDKSQIILKTKSAGGEVSFFLQNLTKNSLERIRDNVDEISWQTGMNRVFYKYYDAKTQIRSLNVSDPDGKNWQKIIDVAHRDVSIAQIPKSGMVSYWNYPDAFVPTVFMAVPIMGGEAKTILEGVYGADYLWDDAGNRILVSQSDVKGGSKIQLGVTNYNGGEYQNLGIPTFVSKCVWSKDGKTVFYALPSGMPETAILPNEYNEKKFNSADTFWQVNIETGEKKRLVETTEIKEKYDADSLFLDNSENFLFFVNRVSGQLYKITL